MISAEQLRAALPKTPERSFEAAIDAPKIGSGKVRDIYDLGDELLLVATDRISAFDVVLPGGIAGRGMVLTQVSRFWFERTLGIVPNQIPENESHTLQNELGLEESDQLRCMVVRKLKPLPLECVVRGYLAGSGWSSYERYQSVCGIQLPSGLESASRLPEPIFTPTTKAAKGHDLPLSEEKAARLVGKDLFERVRSLSLDLYGFGHDLAAKSGILLADTKFEFGQDAEGRVYLIDEALTPDSSRYWEAKSWRPGHAPASFDKQIVRDYLDGLDWDKTPPGPSLPPKVVTQALNRYLEVYHRLTQPN